MYRNNVSIYTGPSTTNQYTDSDVTAVHMYSVIATSCAGNNTSNVVTSVSIGGECMSCVCKTGSITVKLLKYQESRNMTPHVQYFFIVFPLGRYFRTVLFS